MKRNVKMPKWALILICALASVAVLAIGATIITTLTGVEFKQLNEDNLINVDSYDIADDKSGEIKFDVKDDGQIEVKGENSTEENAEKAIISVVLDEGQYTISSGAKKTSSSTFYLILRDTEGGEIIADDTFTVTEPTSYTLYIVVKPGVEIDTTFAPVLVKGDKPGNYYQYGIFND